MMMMMMMMFMMMMMMMMIFCEVAGSVGRYHCVGHSLGSHTCGFAGKSLSKLGLRMSRISALDPAGPLFLKEALGGDISRDPLQSRNAENNFL